MEMKEDKIVNLYFKIFPEKIMSNHSYRLKHFVREVSGKYCSKGGKIIDVGAGTCQYKDYFKNLRYFSQDIQNNRQESINYVGGFEILPSNYFDYVLCTQVLEHLKDPNSVFKHFHRILKKKGKVFLTAPMTFEEHSIPNDYFRFTRYGLRYLAEQNGFRVIKIIPQGGRFLVLAKELQILWPRLIKKKEFIWLYYLIFSLPLFFLNLVLFLLDFLDKDKSLTINYECIFSKAKE